MSERRKPSEPPWPSPQMLQGWGLVRCAGSGCTSFVNPTLDLYPEDNEGRRFCQRHQRTSASPRKPFRDDARNFAELRFAPKPERRERRRRDERWAA